MSQLQLASVPALLIAALLVCLAPAAHADKNSDAKLQFEAAVKMRTMLEGYLERDRSVNDYKQTIAAYQKVYLISAQAGEVTSSFVAEAELYEEMGRLFDPGYYRQAIGMYDFLLKQYSRTRFRADSLLAMARIEKDDLNEPGKAEAALQEYVKDFPRGSGAASARAALKAIAEARTPPPAPQLVSQAKTEEVVAGEPVVTGTLVEPKESENETPYLKGVRTWNSPGDARIILSLGDTIKFKSARIASPDRIYFDLSKLQISPDARKPVKVDAGLLKSVRIAPNRHDVVRVVLDVNGAKDYSAFLVSHPYRLVIDVHAKPTNPTTAAAAPSQTAPLAPSAAAATDDAVVAAKRPVASAGSHPKAKLASAAASVQPPSLPSLTRDGRNSLTRELGLKISRIVIDPGHGGKDTGTIGPHGLTEKAVCLDVALRLGELIQKKLPGAEVIYTRKDDTFIPLEERTAIANREKADLFISIHANSSRSPQARGVETYYLNFTSSPDSMEVATRENATSQTSLHDLQDLIRKIARNDKIEESKELASDVQESLSSRLELVSRNERNRGVKKAPFVVLIGANMPSVLAEISFVSNPADERLLRKPSQRQRIADGIYRGIASYLKSLNSLSYNQPRIAANDRSAAGGAPAGDGNQK
ncbi:MAG TPA: N-acetylmuramoyl-L-alanine amidase [Candidatus Acidoferrales bacterium]|nr:N-acetylmuramoyl-L-alanine amidase [Candidatus Acidoferrales bacterium]